MMEESTPVFVKSRFTTFQKPATRADIQADTVPAILPGIAHMPISVPL